jgi:hypothetical protein
VGTEITITCREAGGTETQLLGGAAAGRAVLA